MTCFSATTDIEPAKFKVNDTFSYLNFKITLEFALISSKYSSKIESFNTVSFVKS